MKAVAPTTFARMSESLMSRKPLHKRLSRGLATRRSLPPIVEKNWRQKLPGGSPQGCEMPVEIGRRGRQQLRLLQHRQLPARFDDGELHLSHGENALAAQLHAQVVEIVVEPLQRAFQNLSVLDDDGGLAVQQLAQAAAVQTETGSDQAPKRPQQQRQPRRDELEVPLDGQA